MGPGPRSWYGPRTRGYLDGMRGSGIGGVIYLVIGVLVAVAQNYFDHLNTLGRLLSAILAVMLWPLLLFGIDIRVS